MLKEREIESCYLGQFIPAHYHHNMLMDQQRMRGFKAAIDYAVFPGAVVLELGGGTGVLSWFAAEKADKVYCVEFNPDLVAASRKSLAMNPNGQRVQVIHADAFEYLPPEPVDLVICEMLHVGLLREKQLELIESFKRRYLAHFGGRLPVFLPEAVIMAVQPVQQDYHFEGFYAPIVQFQHTGVPHPGTLELAEPAVYSIVDFSQDNDMRIAWEGSMAVDKDGVVNALRFIGKNILALVNASSSTIDWINDYMTVPLEKPVQVRVGDTLQLSFAYRAGGPIASLQAALRAEVLTPARPQGAAQLASYA
ncbi:MAG: methyltransferase domain-containing protein [Pseudomonadota bacterium]